jgi:hypothetical protein
MTFNFNHPLAQTPMTICVEINSIMVASDEPGGRCQDALSDPVFAVMVQGNCTAH